MARPLPARRHYGSADAPRGKDQQPLGATVGCERGPGGDPTRHDADQDEVHIEHHAFPELAECPAGPPTAFRTHGDACRQERTECNGRRNLPARAECNARDNCQYAPSVPAPETGRHVVCGNVGRRPRFGSLPSSAACLPDVGERACLPIHRSTSATAAPPPPGYRAGRAPLSPSRHSIALTVFSESAIACSTRAKTVSTPAGSILGQRHRRRVWRGPVILAWRPLCIDRRHRHLRRPMESAARHAGSRWPPHETAAGRRSGLAGPSWSGGQRSASCGASWCADARRETRPGRGHAADPGRDARRAGRAERRGRRP